LFNLDDDPCEHVNRIDSDSLVAEGLRAALIDEMSRFQPGRIQLTCRTWLFAGLSSVALREGEGRVYILTGGAGAPRTLAAETSSWLTQRARRSRSTPGSPNAPFVPQKHVLLQHENETKHSPNAAIPTNVRYRSLVRQDYFMTG